MGAEYTLPDASQVITWPGALVALAIVFGLLMWPGLLAWLNSRAARKAAEDTAHQVHPNSGKSLRDSTNRMEEDVKVIKACMVSHQEYVERRDAEVDERPEALENRPTRLFRRR